MDNYQLPDLNLDFEFDFQYDFTAGENHIIDDILANSVETDGLFETGQPLIENSRIESSSFFEYLCNDSGTSGELGVLDQLPQTQLLPFECNETPASHELLNSANITSQIEITTPTIQDVSFDWTMLIDKSPSQLNVAEEKMIIEQSDSVDSANVVTQMIHENGCIYQELKTLDVAKMHTELRKKFGFDELKKLDDRINYATLSTGWHTSQSDNDTTIAINKVPLTKKKVFILPFENGRNRPELQRLTKKFENNPAILNSICNQCENKTNAKKYRLAIRPKQIRQKSERYLTPYEQFTRIDTMKIELPMNNSYGLRRKRKQIINTDKEKVPVKCAVSQTLTGINENQLMLNKAKNMAIKSRSVKRNENVEFVDESKRSRRSSKKNNIN